jgi:hypothetical protein
MPGNPLIVGNDLTDLGRLGLAHTAESNASRHRDSELAAHMVQSVAQNRLAQQQLAQSRDRDNMSTALALAHIQQQQRRDDSALANALALSKAQSDSRLSEIEMQLKGNEGIARINLIPPILANQAQQRRDEMALPNALALHRADAQAKLDEIDRQIAGNTSLANIGSVLRLSELDRQIAGNKELAGLQISGNKDIATINASRNDPSLVGGVLQQGYTIDQTNRDAESTAALANQLQAAEDARHEQELSKFSTRYPTPWGNSTSDLSVLHAKNTAAIPNNPALAGHAHLIKFDPSALNQITRKPGAWVPIVAQQPINPFQRPPQINGAGINPLPPSVPTPSQVPPGIYRREGQLWRWDGVNATPYSETVP